MSIPNNPSGPENPSYFRTEIVVQPDDIDLQGHVNNVVYVRWAQQVASAHWDAMAPVELRSEYRWVVLRHEIDYLHPAFLNDQITGYTWVSSVEGARSARHVKLCAGDKELAIAKTNWCLLDAKTMKPKRIGPDIKAWLERNL